MRILQDRAISNNIWLISLEKAWSDLYETFNKHVSYDKEFPIIKSY